MSQVITISDNNQQGLKLDDGMCLDNLKKLSERPLCELDLEEHPHLLVFPQDFKTQGDDIGKERIFTVEGNLLKTGNIMGFVGYRGTQVRIHSRFANDDDRDYFLHYMLQRVFAINLFDLKYDSDSESVFDFLVYLFPTFLKRALRQGLYKEYQSRQYNDANIRGRIDVSRHIQKNIPFAGKVAYSTREYVADNHVTQLIRHTIEYIASHPYCGNILANDEETKEAVGIINAATPSYNRHDRHKVIGQNLRPVSHPYFGDYRPLQRLCLQILRHEELKYGSDDKQIYGVLFDGAWLWEEYINTILGKEGFEHPRNKKGEGRKYLFVGNLGACYPDFYSKEMVLDAKYKGYSEWKDVQNADLFQVIAYMHVLGLNRGGFLVPKRGDNKLFPRDLNGHGGQLSVFGMNVSIMSESYRDYVVAMQKEESVLLDEIASCISKS